MLDFLARNVGTIIVGIILAVIIALIVAGMLRKRRQGKCAGCDCAGCAGCQKAVNKRGIQ